MRAATATIDHVFFDLDGTLVDSLPGIGYAVERAFSRAGLRPARLDFRTLMGPPIRSILQNLAAALTEHELDVIEREFRAVYDAEGWQRTTCYPGIVQALARLEHGGKACYLITNKPLLPTRNIVRMLAIGSYFDDLVTSDSRKPPFASKTEMLDSLIVQHRLDPRHCLMVGDTIEDYRAGMAAGMNSVIMSYGYGNLDGLELPETALLDSLSEVTSLVLSAG